MQTSETSWYEMIGNEDILSINRKVQCETFATAISIDELKDVAIECVVPMVKVSYQISDRSDNVVKEGSYAFSDEGVNRFTLQEALPLLQATHRILQQIQVLTCC